MLGHESAGLTLYRYGHLYGSDIEAVGIAINNLLTRMCGQNVGTGADSGPVLRAVPELRVILVEPRGFEPLTSALQRQRSTN
jgi:hypothetical protein